MSKVDAGLRFLAEQSRPVLEVLAAESVFNVVQPVDAPATAVVLVQFTGDIADLERAGLAVRGVAGDVATGEIRIDQVGALAELDTLVRIEVSRVLHRELDRALPEARVSAVHVGPPGNRGEGVVVGIIDSGIDYLHPAFQKPDGGARIVRVWDQGLPPLDGEGGPAGFAYGVEYRQPAIDAAVAASLPRHQERGAGDFHFHGTHVAGIAAGNGAAAGQGQPAGTFVGVAPAASIVCVANTAGRAEGELGLGDSANALEAVQYIFAVAAELGKPAVINMSLGDNLGPHDGTSLLERGIDNLLGGPGRVMVKSAGNEGDRSSHASGRLARNESQEVSVVVPAGRRAQLLIDLWYYGRDRIGVRLTPPKGDTDAILAEGFDGAGFAATTSSGNTINMYAELDDPSNHDNRVLVVVSRGDASEVEPGTWQLTLNGLNVTSGRWDGWIQRSDTARCRFGPPFADAARTISIPGTGRKILTAGSYVTRRATVGATVGKLALSSSRGPTRDGRLAPIVATPGELIIAPQPLSTGDPYGLLAGTSMAAPVLTGVVALMLAKNPNLTASQVRDIIVRTARKGGYTGTTPNDAWGAGMLDAAAAVAAVSLPV